MQPDFEIAIGIGEGQSDIVSPLAGLLQPFQVKRSLEKRKLCLGELQLSNRRGGRILGSRDIFLTGSSLIADKVLHLGSPLLAISTSTHHDWPHQQAGQ